MPLRVQMSPARMKGLLGNDFAMHAMEAEGEHNRASGFVLGALALQGGVN